jgi:hypothetical protein
MQKIRFYYRFVQPPSFMFTSPSLPYLL